MKIIQINSVYNVGSTGRIVANISEVITSIGGSCKIIARNTVPANLGLSTSRFELYFDVMISRMFGLHALSLSRGTSQVIEFIKSQKPDVIHLHNIHGYYLNYEILFKYLKDAKIPVVWTFHDCWPLTGHCAHFSAVSCSKWRTGCFSCPQLKSYPKSLFFDRTKYQYKLKYSLFNSIDNLTIVTVSKWLNEIVSKSYLKNIPSIVINNGLDIDVFKHTNSKLIDTDKLIYLSVASQWNKSKGLPDLLELSTLLTQDEVLVIVGLTEKQIKILPPNIIGIKNTNNLQELTALYSQASILLSLSVEETFGMTIIEGFACGTPAIVYNSTATPELIDDSVGLIVEPHDITGVRTAIDTIRNSPVDYKTHCEEKAKEYYNKNDRYQDYISLYKKLINENIK